MASILRLSRSGAQAATVEEQNPKRKATATEKQRCARVGRALPFSGHASRSRTHFLVQRATEQNNHRLQPPPPSTAEIRREPLPHARTRWPAAVKRAQTFPPSRERRWPAGGRQPWRLAVSQARGGSHEVSPPDAWAHVGAVQLRGPEDSGRNCRRPPCKPHGSWAHLVLGTTRQAC
jgi:hypothetical protein